MKLGPEEVSAAISEAEHERFWRYRCAEPCPGHYPVRCRRDLGHPDGHVGIGGRIVSEFGEQPVRYGTTYVSWPGVGNPASAQAGRTPGAFRCWCTLRREGTEANWWAVREYPRRCP